jgi:hypothetical protein
VKIIHDWAFVPTPSLHEGVDWLTTITAQHRWKARRIQLVHTHDFEAGRHYIFRVWVGTRKTLAPSPT